MKIFNKKSIILSVCIQTLLILVLALPNTANAANPIIRIKLSGTVYSDETIIRYNPVATTGFDFDLDASKFMSTGTTPSMYTIINTKKYSINTLPSPDSLVIIQLGSKILETSSYSISFVNSTDMNGYSLYDKFLSTEVQIDSSSTYTFTGTVGDAQNRFELHYTTPVTPLVAISFLDMTSDTIVDPNPSFNKSIVQPSTLVQSKPNVSVGSTDGGMHLMFENGTPENYTIHVISHHGRIMKTIKSENVVSNSQFIGLDGLEAGSYVVIIRLIDTESSYHISLL